MFRPSSRPRPAPLLAAAAVLLSATGMGALPSRADAPPATPKPEAYLSLGDSLAAGMQPDAAGRDRPTSAGYANVVARTLAPQHPRLRMVRLSCGGATTVTLMDGGAACQPRGQPGQLVQAERYAAAHHDVSLTTVNIGDNDVEGCVRTRPASIDAACVRRGRAVVARNLPRIARRLRAAAGPHVPVVGLVDYDQFLALWLDGSASRAVARRSVGVIMGLNALMAKIYRQAGVLVADAGPRFSTGDMTTQGSLTGVGAVPLDVQRICQWTWACSGPPINHDDHARPEGYRQIAASVIDVLRPNGGASAP